MAKIKVINKRQGADLIGANFKNVASETIFSFGNFTVDTNFASRTVKKYSNTLSSFVKPITLEKLNLSEEDSKHVYQYSQEVLLNFDKSDLNVYARFGSLSEILNVSIEKIIYNFPASLFLTYQQSSFVNLMSVTNYFYDKYSDTSYFKIPTASITNKFGLVVNDGNSQLPEGIELRNINMSYGDYVIWRAENPSNNDFEIIGFTGYTQNNPNLTIQVKGNPFFELTGTTQGQFNYHIKPKPVHFNKFKENLSVLESYLINEKITGLTNSGYKTVFKIPTPSENGDVIYSNKEILWSSFDRYNVDIDGYGFNTFISDIAFIGDLYDQFKSDLVARMLVPSSIFENDNTSDEKMKKLIRLYGASFDNLKVFIDALVTINKLSYDKNKNVPDILVKNLARTMGWDATALIHEDDLLEGFFSTEDKKSNELLPSEVDIELWRRILINTNYLFKSKGTREAIKTMLLMVGIPEPFINITEYIYTVTQKINPNTVTVDLSELASSTLPYDSNGYPIAPQESKTFYFQVSGNSDSGQAYMDNFRKVGFVLNRTIDNKKSWEEAGEVERIHYTTPNYYQKDSKLVLNTKEVDVTLDIARGIEYDVYKYNVENNYPLTSTGVTKPFLYINIPFTYGSSAIIFTIPETPQGDIQVNFNGITLVKGTGAGDTTADYYINPFDSKEAILIGGTAEDHSNGYKDIITLTYAKDKSEGSVYAQVDYIVSKITVNPDGIVIPLVEEPLGEVQLIVDGKTMSKSTTLFTGDYVINPSNPMELIVVNNDLKNYLIAHPVVTISYIKSNNYEPILKKSEVHVVNSFSDIKFYYNGTLNKYTYVLDYEPPNEKAVKIIVNGITLQNGNDFILNSTNRKQVLFNTTSFSLGYVINAFYITSDSVEQSFNFGSFDLPNLSQITFLEYLEIINRRLINVKNRKTITDHEGGMYPTVQKIYEEYLKRVHAPQPLTPSNGYNFGNVYPFINRFNTYFHKFIEQLLSATIILKRGGVLVRNTSFTKQKFTYRRGVSFDSLLNYLGDDGSEFIKRLPVINFNYMWTGTTCVIVPDVMPPSTTTTTSTSSTTTSSTTLPPVIFYMLGNDLYVRKTTNAGVTWNNTINYPIRTNLATPTMTKATWINSTGYVLANGNVIYKTIDGGGNWVELTAPTPVNQSYLTTIYAINENTVILGTHASNVNYTYRSIDGGLTWNAASKPQTTINKIEFISTTFGYGINNLGIIGGYPQFVRTLDGGSSWNSVNLLPNINGSETLYHMSSSVYGMIYLAAGTNIHKSNDYGNTWTTISPLPTYGVEAGNGFYAYVVKVFSNGVVIAAGTTNNGLYNIIIRSTDAGSTWMVVYANSTSVSNGYVLNGYGNDVMTFSDDNNGIITLVSNTSTNTGQVMTKVLRTTNNGVTWSYGGIINSPYVFPTYGHDISSPRAPLPSFSNPITTTSTTTLTPVTLTVDYVSGQFEFILSQSITNTLTIYSTVVGSQTFNCGPFEEDDNLFGFVINAGTNSVSTNGSSALTCSVNLFKISDLNVNGSAVTNGSTITVGAYNITISYNPNCVTYNC